MAASLSLAPIMGSSQRAKGGVDQNGGSAESTVLPPGVVLLNAHVDATGCRRTGIRRRQIPRKNHFTIFF